MRPQPPAATRPHLRAPLAIALALACWAIACGGSGLHSPRDATTPSDHDATAVDAGVDTIDARDAAAVDGGVDLLTDAGSDQPSSNLPDARDTPPSPPPTCPTYVTSTCSPGLVCYLGTGGSQTSMCTCHTSISDAGSWACLPITPPPPPPPPLPIDAAADVSLAGPDGGFTNSCVDCLRADRCQGTDPTSPFSLTAECQGLSTGPSFGLLGQVLANCQGTISQFHCP